MTELRSGAYRSRRTVWEFLKGFAKVVIGGALLLQAFLFISVFALLLSILGAVSEGIEQSKAPDVRANIKAGTTLYFNPVGILAETSPGRDPIEEALDEVFGGRIGPVGIHDLVRVIQTAKDDERISAMVVDLQELAIPNIYLSKANLLADAIEEFRDAGKRVWAVGDYYTQGQYLIASEADEILLNHQGGVMLDGYGNYRLYYASLLERLDVTSHVFRVGTYKSAVEPYLRDDMSPEAKEAASKYLQVLWDATTSRIEANRPIGPGTAKVYAETLPAVVRSSGGDLAEAAKSAGLVDRIVTRQELESFLTDKVGEDEDGELNTVEFVDYADDVKPPRNRPTIDDVMIVTVQGPIMDGDNEPGVASGEYVSEKLREARETESVKAVVLRVDSPGGSVFASELIRQEVLAVKAAGKPVVVSMGSLAASGGYWISAPADNIWAEETTLTGSIGVFAYLQTYENLAARYGVYTDGVGTTPLSALRGAGIGPLPEASKDLIQQSVEHTYDDFLSRVAEGRDLSVERVAEIAEGRVWIGKDAKELELVDAFGGLTDAIDNAASLAGLEDWDVTTGEKSLSKIEQFLKDLGADVSAGLMSGALRAFVGGQGMSGPSAMGAGLRMLDEHVSLQATFDDPRGIYARCLACEPQ